jgi:hypothetical protein
MSSKKGVRFFYQVASNVFYINDGDDNELKQETVLTKDIDNYNYFEAFSNYECDLESLKQYRDDFNKWALELKETDEGMKIIYTQYFNHEHAVLHIFERRSKNILESLQMDDVIFDEFYIYEMCNNGALMNLDNKYKNNGAVKSYGYDHSSYHPTLLSSNFHSSPFKRGKKIGQSFLDNDFKIPIKHGKLTTLKLDINDYNKLKYGIYRCCITCDNENFKKVFAFNKNCWYSHYDIKFACKYRKEYDITIIFTECDNNALIYEDEDLIYTHDIFRDWYYELSKLKKAHPKNKLLKHLFSSLWGSLIRYEREFIEGDEIYKKDVSDKDSEDKTEYKIVMEKYYKCDNALGCKTLYTIVKTNKPYSNNLARLKPFFTSFLRVNIGELCIKENILDNVIRVHTDNITLSKQHDFRHLKYFPIKEDKTTGIFLWKNVNKYPSYDEKTNTYTWRNEPYINK